MAIESGYTTNGGSNAGLFTEGASRLGLASQRIDPREIPSRLMAGQSVIMSGVKRGSGSPYTSSGHIISASKMKDGKIVVNDPLKSNSSAMPVSSVMSGINKAWAIDGPHGYGDEDDDKYLKTLLGYGPFTYETSTGGFIPTMSSQLGRPAYPVFGDSNTANWYSQSDPEWASVDWCGDTVGSIGCLLSSFGMAMNAMTGGIDFDPGSMAAMFPGNGSGVSGDEPYNMAALIKANYERYYDYDFDNLDEMKAKIIEFLEKGYPVIIDGETANKPYDVNDNYPNPEDTIAGDSDFWAYNDIRGGIFAHLLDGNSKAKHSEHHTMILGYQNKGDAMTTLFNPGRSSEENGVRIVNLDRAFDNYKSGEDKFGTIKGFRVFTRDFDLSEKDNGEIRRNLQAYCGLNADGFEDIQKDDKGNQISPTEAQLKILNYFKTGSKTVANASEDKLFTSHADDLMTAALSSTELGTVKAGDITPGNITAGVSSDYKPTTKGNPTDGSESDPNSITNIFERVGNILGKFGNIGLNLLSAILSGHPENYKSIYDGNWTYQDNDFWKNQQRPTDDTDAYISIGKDRNGQPILVSASVERGSAVNDAISQYEEDYLAMYEEKLSHPSNPADAEIYRNYLEHKNRDGGDTSAPLNDGEHNYYRDGVLWAHAKALDEAENIKAIYDEAVKNNDFYDIDGNPLSSATVNTSGAKSSSSPSASSASSSTSMKMDSFPEWATKHTGKYGLDPSTFTPQSTSFTSGQLSDMQKWLMYSIAAHERGYTDNMTDNKIDEVYFSPVNYGNEDAATFGIGGFKGPNGSEVMLRLADSGQIDETAAKDARDYAAKLASGTLDATSIKNLTAFMRRSDIRVPLKTIEEAYSSQLTGLYLNRALPYYDDGTITDPRSVLLGAETYPISYKADWFNDLPATTPENELEVVRDNILAHMRGWDTWDEDDGDSETNNYKGWTNRVWNDYHMLTQNGASGYTDTGTNDYAGIVNPPPPSIFGSGESAAETSVQTSTDVSSETNSEEKSKKNTPFIPIGAIGRGGSEGYGDLDLNSNIKPPKLPEIKSGDFNAEFKSYSTYKTSVNQNRPLKLSEMGTGETTSSKRSRSPLSITANRSYTPAVLSHSEGYGRGVDMKPMENKTDRVISLLERVAANTGKRVNAETSTTINNYNTTNNTSTVGYGDVNMNAGGKGDVTLISGDKSTPSDNMHTDKLRQLHERIARSPRH